MHDINSGAFNFRQVAIALALIGAVDLLPGCSTTPQPPPPSYAEMVASAPTPSGPKLTGADILARQPKEVQDAITNYQEGAWPTWRSAHGLLVPYTDRMDPVPIDCAPNYHVDVFLLADETPTGVAAGDSERWLIGPATDPSHGGGAVLYVKCKDTGLSGDASIFTSAGRTYPLLLKSKAHSQLRWVKFYDPKTILAQMRAADTAPGEATDPDPIAPPLGTKLNVAYSVSGPNVAWKPKRAFDDGSHVWIEMPQMSSPVRPILLGDDRSQLNYRVRGQYFEIDSLFNKATLVADNQKVFIQRSAQ
jgi:type IV secretory pathway VirB9-like protein